MNKIFMGICASVILAFQGVNAGAAPLRVGTDENLPPFSFSQNGVAVGIDVDMLKEAAKRLNLDLQIKALPWKRILDDVQSGELPLAMPLFRTPEREAFATFTGPTHYSTTGLFVHKGKEFKFNTVDDLTGKRLGNTRGLAIQDSLDKAIKAGKIFCEEATTVDQNISKLMDDRIDALPYNVVSAQYRMKGTPAQKDVVLLPTLLGEKRPAFLVLSKASNIPNAEKEKLISSLTATLEKMHQDGTYDTIVNKYIK